ncbi:hypothetical protein KC19_VG083700 [Ceratodon purpureus]|uniref:Uncharacterized protein n=1 Tax=Ceratodon purpureus TaxID=3225 RepID=A0A8T0HN40_CERPU|nr:hypothetical protein KC19_VG083700 [Ceratodon purpureus]
MAVPIADPYLHLSPTSSLVCADLFALRAVHSGPRAMLRLRCPMADFSFLLLRTPGSPLVTAFNEGSLQRTRAACYVWRGRPPCPFCTSILRLCCTLPGTVTFGTRPSSSISILASPLTHRMQFCKCSFLVSGLANFSHGYTIVDQPQLYLH